LSQAGLAAWGLLHVHCDSVVAAASEPTNQGLLPLISRRVRCAFERTKSSAEEGASKSATHPTSGRVLVSPKTTRTQFSFTLVDRAGQLLSSHPQSNALYCCQAPSPVSKFHTD
jgi:hypothetical protein